MRLSDQIIQVLEYLGEKMGVTIDWSQQNALPYVQQICEKCIRYEIASSVMWIAVGLIFIASTIWWVKAYRICMKKYEETGCCSDWDDAAWLCMAMSVVCVIIGIVTILLQVHDIMRCIFLPEAQIYSYIKELMK